MSRTYRKNGRRFNKIRGEFVDFHYLGKTTPYKDDTRNFRSIDYHEYRSGGGFYKEVIVCDNDSWKKLSAGKKNKRMYHGIDRARFAQALLYNEDAHIKTSMDPWDWD